MLEIIAYSQHIKAELLATMGVGQISLQAQIISCIQHNSFSLKNCQWIEEHHQYSTMITYFGAFGVPRCLRKHEWTEKTLFLQHFFLPVTIQDYFAVFSSHFCIKEIESRQFCLSSQPHSPSGGEKVKLEMVFWRGRSLRKRKNIKLN